MRVNKLILLTLVFCLAVSGQVLAKTEVTFWHAMSSALGETVNELVAEFNAQNPDIHVEAIYQGGYGDLNTKLVASITAQNSPVLAQVYENWTDAFIRNDVLVPLEDYLHLTDEEYNDYVEVFRNMNIWDGKLYTVPFNKSNWVLFYNTDLVPNPPKTVDEFLALSKKISDEGQGDVFGFGIRPTVELFHAFMYLNGGDFFDEDLNITFTGQEGIDALNLMINMIDDKSALLIDGYESNALGDGIIAMYIGSSAGASFVEAAAEGKVNWSMAPIPAGARPGAPFMGTNIALFATATEEQREAAAKFVKFLTNTENTVTWAIRTGYLPVTYSGLESEAWNAFLADNPRVAEGPGNLEAFEYGYWQPRVAAWEGARSSIGNAVEAALLKYATPEEALAQAALEIEEEIALMD
ncbi:MAG: ABC transporter substrate-binding protein [Firmicutes bacterium]|nr:ABC transporter substrate-binding protein [Bacillota bacterium]